MFFPCPGDGASFDIPGKIKCVYMQCNVRVTVGMNAKFHTGAVYRVSQEECARFGRVFLMLKYTDITQNTYVQI